MHENVIIVAAGMGTRLAPHTDHAPKCMVQLHDQPMLHWNLEAVHAADAGEVAIVGGYKIDQLKAPGAKVFENPDYATTNMVYSLWCAESFFGDGFVMSYGDIVYQVDVLKKLFESTHDIAVVVDKNWQSYWERRVENIFDDAESLVLKPDGSIASIGQKTDDPTCIQGQYIGLVAFRGEGLVQTKALIEREREANAQGRSIICENKTFENLYMTDLLQGLINEGRDVQPVWIEGDWLEVDTASDLELAGELSKPSASLLQIMR